MRIHGVCYTGLVACTVCSSDSAVHETRGAAAVTPRTHRLTLDRAQLELFKQLLTAMLLNPAEATQHNAFLAAKMFGVVNHPARLVVFCWRCH
jgi:hypothetical protein